MGVCSAVADADDTDFHPGLVYMAGVKHEHESALEFSGEVLAFPMREAARSALRVIYVQVLFLLFIAATEAFLIISGQAFGGCGHHRCPYMHHSADFVASEGSDLLRVCDGVVIVVNDSKPWVLHTSIYCREQSLFKSRVAAVLWLRYFIFKLATRLCRLEIRSGEGKCLVASAMWGLAQERTFMCRFTKMLGTLMHRPCWRCTMIAAEQWSLLRGTLSAPVAG